MKKYLYLFIISFTLTNCYTYKVSAETDETTQGKNESKRKPDPEEKSNVQQLAVSSMAIDGEASPKVHSKGLRNTKKDNKPKPTNITEKLEAGKFFKIDVADRSYKIQVDKWESDTLVAHVIHKPKKILKFHKNQINQSTIAERRFSQPVADIITVTAYAGIGVGIWALVR